MTPQEREMRDEIRRNFTWGGDKTMTLKQFIQHTPGPWKWERYWLMAGQKSTRKVVLWYTTNDDGVHCTPGDARLLAEAPAMYEVLQQVAALHFRMPANVVEVVEVARAILARIDEGKE